MSIVATQRFTGRGAVIVSNAWVARESWVVTGTNDPSVAIAAAVSFNAPHVDNPNMRAGRRWAESFKGPLSWIVFAEFTFGDHGAGALTPLLEPPVLMWDYGTTSIATSTDENDNDIVNSANYPIDPSPSITVPIVGLCVRRAEPFFDVQKMINYGASCNSDQFTIAGAGVVAPGQAYCQYINPAQPYTSTAPFVYVEYRFEFMGGTNPFDIHVIDAGREGWYSNSGTPMRGPFCMASGNQVTSDIRLDGTGKPIFAGTLDGSGNPTGGGFFVLDVNGKPQAPISAPTLPTGLVIESAYSSGNQKTLLWSGKVRRAFAGIL